jgi:hypothetical protein
MIPYAWLTGTSYTDSKRSITAGEIGALVESATRTPVSGPVDARLLMRSKWRGEA